MRELAKQRAIQLQKEEEERTREQKAKALAKLEELNRRSQGDNALKTEKAPLGLTQHEVHEQQTCTESSMDGAKSQDMKPSLASISDVIPPISMDNVQCGDESVNLASNLSSDRPKSLPLEPVVLDGQSLKQESDNGGTTSCKASSQMNEGGTSRHKRNSFKPKQNAPQQKNSTEQTDSVPVTKVPKDESEIASNEASVVTPGEILSSGESNLTRVPNFVAEPSAQQRRRNNRGTKKHKMDDAPLSSTSPSAAPNESKSLEACIQNENSKVPPSDFETGAVEAVITAVDGSEPSMQHSSFHYEESQGRVSNNRKPQQSRRFPRNQQSNRFVDKFHGNDNVMWAPVKSQNKAEAATEMSQQTVQEPVTSAKSDNQVQSNYKSKRAEMERYVPKPVAKELAQQGNVPQPISSSVELSTSDECAQREESGSGRSGSLQLGGSATGNIASTAEYREVDSRLNKHVKAHGAWRQRGSIEAPQNGPSYSTANSSKINRTPVGQTQSMKPELTSAKAEGKVSVDSNVSDDQSISNDSGASAPVVLPVVRDQGVTGKGKRHTLKAEKSMGFNPDHDKNLSSGEADRSHIQFTDLDIKHAEKVTVSKESRGFEERSSSHWQPKPHPSSNNSQRGCRSTIGHGVTGEMGGVVKKDYPSQPHAQVQPHVKESSDKDCSHLDQSASEKKLLEVANVGHQGHRKERKIPTSKGLPYSPNEGTSGADESSFTSADIHNKQHFSSDIKRTRNQNNHPGTSRESRGDWNQEKQRQNIHYEYHPVGSHNNSKPEKFEDASHNLGPRYKDRGQTQSKRGRGNFHARQSGSIRVDASSG